MTKARQKPPIQFRPSDDMEEYLREKAAQSFRSVNKEVQFRLEQYRQIEQREAQKGSEK